jgi:hypothetical protein
MSQKTNDNANTWEAEMSQTDDALIAETQATKANPVPEDESDGVDDRSRMQKATIMLLVACVLGVGAMYLIKMKKKTAAPSEQIKTLETQVDLALQKLTNHDEQVKTKQMFRDSQEMIQLFYGYPASQQVSLKELQRDPFTRQTTSQPVVKASGDEAKQLEKLRRDLDKKFGALKLQSVIQMTDGSKCLINGQIYSLGQVIADVFTITSINEKSVTLTAGVVEYVLKM